MQNSSRQTRPMGNKVGGGWTPRAKDFASDQRFLAKQQAKNLRKLSEKKLDTPPATPPPAQPS